MVSFVGWPENDENPWNLLSKTDALICKANEPKIGSLPTNDTRPKYKLSIVNQDEFLNSVSHLIGSNCWSVFSRDKYHNVHTLYFFFRRQTSIFLV